MHAGKLCWHCSDPIDPMDDPGLCSVPEHLDCCVQALAEYPDDLHAPQPGAATDAWTDRWWATRQHVR